MTKELAAKFSWFGLKQNASLKSTTIGGILNEVCCEMFKITTHQVNLSVSEVLRRKSTL